MRRPRHLLSICPLFFFATLLFYVRYTPYSILKLLRFVLLSRCPAFLLSRLMTFAARSHSFIPVFVFQTTPAPEASRHRFAIVAAPTICPLPRSFLRHQHRPSGITPRRIYSAFVSLLSCKHGSGVWGGRDSWWHECVDTSILAFLPSLSVFCCCLILSATVASARARCILVLFSSL